MNFLCRFLWSYFGCYLHWSCILILKMEWSRPKQQGDIPRPRAGHAGVTVGENWFIVGGGDNTSGMYLRAWYIV